MAKHRSVVLPHPEMTRAQPLTHQSGAVIQSINALADVDIGIEATIRAESIRALNQILADTIMLRDLYKKHHWQVAGPTFYALHLLLDKHAGEQSELVDGMAERIQSLGGISLAMPQDIAAVTSIAQPPTGREDTPAQLSRLLDAHKIVLVESRKAAKAAADSGDDGTNDMLVSDVIRTNEVQVWFIAQHLAAVPLLHAEKK